MRPGAVTRAAAVYRGCRGGRGGRLILQRAHKKSCKASVCYGAVLCTSPSVGFHVAVPPKERAVLLRRRLCCGPRRAG